MSVTEDKVLSIVIPCYNEKDNILNIVKLVQASPIPNKEIIVVDDCSTDGTREILETEIRPLVSKIIFHGCHRPASSLPGSVLRRLFLCRQKKNWRHCHSWLRKICLLPSISLLKSLRMELPLFRFRKSSGFINIPPCTNSSGTISVSPIRCVSLRKSTYTSSVRRT